MIIIQSVVGFATLLASVFVVAKIYLFLVEDDDRREVKLEAREMVKKYKNSKEASDSD